MGALNTSNSFTPPLSIEVSTPKQESGRSCTLFVFVLLSLSILPLFTILIFDFRIAQNVWYSSLRKCYRRHHDLVNRCVIHVSKMTTDMFRLWYLQSGPFCHSDLSPGLQQE